MDMPMLIIATVYPGASPEDVNDLVTTEIEDEIGSLSGVDTIQSQSMENMSFVMIQYDYGKDIDEAYDDLKKKMDIVEATPVSYTHLDVYKRQESGSGSGL